jgi:hypothetical protein
VKNIGPQKSPVNLKKIASKAHYVYNHLFASSVKKINLHFSHTSQTLVSVFLGSSSNGRCSEKERAANGATDGGVADISRATAYAYAVCRSRGATGSFILVFSSGGGTDASASVRLLHQSLRSFYLRSRSQQEKELLFQLFWVSSCF